MLSEILLYSFKIELEVWLTHCLLASLTQIKIASPIDNVQMLYRFESID